MYNCLICNKQFNHKGHFTKHVNDNVKCNTIKELNQLQQLVNKKKEKYNKLKIIANDIFNEKNIAQAKIIELEKMLKDQKKKHKKEIYNLNDEKNLYYHEMIVAQQRMEERSRTTKEMIEMSKTNNTIINNTVVLQDFRIMPVKEFSDDDLNQITDVIRDNDVYKVCLHILKEYYGTIPPNIIIQDQARKKISLVRNNRWVQESWNNLIDDLYYRSFQKVAYMCIDRVQDKHRAELEYINDYDEKQKYKNEIEIWGYIRQTWNNCKSRDLSNSLIVDIKNAQEAARAIEM